MPTKLAAFGSTASTGGNLKDVSAAPSAALGCTAAMMQGGDGWSQLAAPLVARWPWREAGAAARLHAFALLAGLRHDAVAAYVTTAPGASAEARSVGPAGYPAALARRVHAHARP